MSKLSKQRAKERFLSNVDSVDKSAVLDEIRTCEENDLYTYFVRANAFKTGVLDPKDINEFLLKVYSDWYFLHKNTPNKNARAVKVLSEYEFAPVNLAGDSCLQLVKNGEYKDVLPVFFQYTNKLEEKYFICVKIDEMYNRVFPNVSYQARFYLNLKKDKLLDFAREFVDKAYMTEFPALLKVLNNDYRQDSIVIYTDFEYAQIVLDVIEEIKKDTPSIFDGVGKVSTLLGSINDYIGFGEQVKNNLTYFSSRCQALSSMHRMAGIELLKKGIVAEEKKIIFRTDGSSYTPTEYLEFLIEKNVIRLVEDKIEELELNNSSDLKELDRLYDIRENVSLGINMKSEVDKLKKSITRNSDYLLEVEGVGEFDFDYIAKLYRLFSSSDDRILSRHSDEQKRDIVSSKIFSVTDTFEGVNTREFLDTYFKAKLSLIVKEIIDKDIEKMKRSTQSEVLINIRKKNIEKLRSILSSIVDDGDEGREYIGRCVRDYVRILSTDALENVEIMIDGRHVSLDTDVNSDIISLLPELKESVDKMTLDGEFIDNILSEYGINKDNLCLNSTTRDIHKEKEVRVENYGYGYYYDPEGYLSKTTQDTTSKPDELDEPKNKIEFPEDLTHEGIIED